MFSLNGRSALIAAAMILVALTIVVKLFFIQILDNTYKMSADSNSRRKEVQYPSRGLIFDRNGKLLVSNQAVYDLMIVKREVHNLDSAAFCRSLGIDMPTLRRLFANLQRDIRSRRASSYKPAVFIKQLSGEQYAVFQEKLHLFSGFYAQRRTLRKYEYPAAAHVLGYVGEVNDAIIKRNSYYEMGDYIGIGGIESSYEEQLRGRKGVKYYMVDVLGRNKGSFRDGEFDTLAVSGSNLTLSVDIDLQMYGEKLMEGKTGSIVAIKPQTGEVLAMISAPGYDPSLLVGRARSVNFPLLSNDPTKPLFNRAIQAWYPPGSTFKTINALIGLQEGVITSETRYPCSMGYTVGRFHLGCHSHASPLDLRQSIQHSCNGYYCYVLRAILDNRKYESVCQSLDAWKDYLVKFGLGYRLGVDIANENRGFVPNSDYYTKNKGPRWTSLGVISLAIGQGELLLTPIQMANVAAIIANRGTFYTPHVVHKIEDSVIDDRYRTLHHTGIDPEYFDVVKDGMEMAVWSEWGGTARVARIDSVKICGKTGTAQNPHGKDHSIFMAFAPKDDPQIAIAVYVENAGFGASWAAPIASLMVEKFIRGGISPQRSYLEKRILETKLNADADRK